MTQHKVSASVPVARRDAVNARLNRILGCGPDTFWIPMEDARGVVVRYGTQWRVTAEQREVLQATMSRRINRGDMRDDERIDDHVVRLGFKRRRKAARRRNR